jgi:flavin reductase (DIM6/NTAB) family NADH-FMN oxidoreductase RutF
MIPGKYPAGLRPVRGDAAQNRRERRSALHRCEFTVNLLAEGSHERLIFETLRHPVKAAMELARLKELIPEKQAEQTMPERILRVVGLMPLPPQHPGDACFRIARQASLATDPGAPRLEGALIAFECGIASAVDVATHAVLICEVVGIHEGRGRNALLYFRRAYHGLTTSASRSREAGEE